MQIGEWTFTLNSHELEREGKTIKLEAKCALVLDYLARHKGQVVSQDELLNNVWGIHSLSPQSVPVVISKLRTILGDNSQKPTYIETIAKRGYRLIAKTESLEKITSPHTKRKSYLFIIIIFLLALVGGYNIFHFKQKNSHSVQYGSNIAGVEKIFTQAQYLWSLRGRENNLLALHTAKQALALDPHHVPSLALVAQIYTRYDGAYLGLTDQDTVSLARQSLALARGINPQHPMLLSAEASFFITIDWRPDLALAVLDKAIAISPKDTHTLRLKSVALYMLGQIDEAIETQNKAIKLELNSTHFTLDLVRLNYAKHNYKRALDVAQQFPVSSLTGTALYVAASAYELGEHKKAFEFIDLYFKENDINIEDDFVSVDDNYQAKYNGLLNSLKPELIEQQKHGALVMLMLFAQQNDNALEYLEKLTFSRETNFLNAIHIMPLFNRFKDNERFKKILEKIGVAPMAQCDYDICQKNRKNQPKL